MQEQYYGEVIWFHVKRGYGFISWEINGIKQKDMFLHYSDILLDGFKFVKPGQKIKFMVGKNNSGVDKAIEVEILNAQ